jgi:hypothetical protein
VRPRSGVAVWSSEEWLAGAIEWIDARLAAAGLERTGDASQPHLRPWSTVLRVPTSGGVAWMKATGGANEFEAGLYELLARVVPDDVLIPIGTDVERGWMLLPDGGPPLGERLSGEAVVDPLVEAIVEYGRVQLTLASRVDEMLALGIADMRPAVMPERLEEALAAVEPGPAVEKVAAMRPAVAAWCSRLASSPLPASLDHNDLHPWNVLIADGGRIRFYDWGDAVVAHPFAAMLVPLRVVRHWLGAVSDDDPRLLRARDAYLGVFADFAPPRELVATLETACHVAKIARVLTWDRSLRTAREQGEEIDDDWATAPLETLEWLLSDSYLGGR